MTYRALDDWERIDLIENRVNGLKGYRRHTQERMIDHPFLSVILITAVGWPKVWASIEQPEKPPPSGEPSATRIQAVPWRMRSEWVTLPSLTDKHLYPLE
ncbi:hypothetical protein SAMN04488112_11461 [Melghirimyces thermohalophilus]|uniref:Uncharacterized protein n=2 Tax=Melghirimyces thermohalophilus TaxID=1236220 RepID=A0A1G6NX86_9BACL|nr:hypothetical protein SAMN04488112_11461 [Melghirimyces thermohalophilus]